MLNVTKIHKSGASISIRDTCIEYSPCDIIVLNFSEYLKNENIYISLYNKQKDLFLNGIELDINSYTLGKTAVNEKLLIIEPSVLEIDYYKFKTVGTFTITNNIIQVNSNILSLVGYDDYLFINNELFKIDDRSFTDGLIKVKSFKNTVLSGIYTVYKSKQNKNYFVNIYLLEQYFCKLLEENIFTLENKDCNHVKKLSYDDLVILSLQLQSINIFKDKCDLKSVASLIHHIKNKIYGNESQCGCGNS